MSATINILGLRWTPKNRVRPWALAGPIIVLLICLPLLRPLRWPDPRQISGSESARLATVSALVSRHTLAIDAPTFNVPAANTVVVDGQTYASQPESMAVLLAGAYWVLARCGLTFADHGPTVSYLLTLLGVTLPVAAAAGLVYRMARLFELTRPRRAALGFICVAGTGLISYATVLNPQAPAAVLVMCAAGCLVHVARSPSPWRTSPWMIVAGFCAALASAIDPPAVIFFLLFLPVTLSFRWPIRLRAAAVALYAIGAAAPLALHSAVTVPITGDLLPPGLHAELRRSAATTRAIDDEDEAAQSAMQRLAAGTARIFGALFASHGLLSHFPIVLLGGLGVTQLMHRHWPSSTKVLAGASVLGAVIIVIVFATLRHDYTRAGFASKWFITFTPLLAFWIGVWLRKNHRPGSWTMASIGLAFSVLVSVIGATRPLPPGGYDGYTAWKAGKAMFVGEPVKK